MECNKRRGMECFKKMSEELMRPGHFVATMFIGSAGWLSEWGHHCSRTLRMIHLKNEKIVDLKN